MNSKKKAELDKIINEKNLNKEQTYNFVRKSFEQSKVDTNGIEISNILHLCQCFLNITINKRRKTK